MSCLPLSELPALLLQLVPLSLYGLVGLGGEVERLFGLAVVDWVPGLAEVYWVPPPLLPAKHLQGETNAAFFFF